MNEALSFDYLSKLLSRMKPRRCEGALQAAIAGKLAAHGFEFFREPLLDAKSRADFTVAIGSETILIETKVKGAGSGDTERQLLRYSMTGKIDRIILVTTSGIRLRLQEHEAAGKKIPVTIINLEMNGIA